MHRSVPAHRWRVAYGSLPPRLQGLLDGLFVGIGRQRPLGRLRVSVPARRWGQCIGPTEQSMAPSASNLLARLGQPEVVGGVVHRDQARAEQAPNRQFGLISGRGRVVDPLGGRQHSARAAPSPAGSGRAIAIAANSHASDMPH
jgi:hypothetical protein